MRRLTLLTNPDACNLHCPLCFLNQRPRRGGLGEMPFGVACAAIEKYAAERDGTGNRVLREVIPSTMGEPLLYSNFAKLLEFCGSLGLPLNLTTNGSFPDGWGEANGMEKLLAACSDIKVSSLSAEGGGLDFKKWRGNVSRLLEVRRRMLKGGGSPATVSLQVTLHRENLDRVEPLLRWAEVEGVHRIKWNPAVFLEASPRGLRERFQLNLDEIDSLKRRFRTGDLRSSVVKIGGSLFFESAGGLCPVGGKCGACPFEDEVWVWPDGHEDHCPNPERRWGGWETSW